MAGCEPSEAIIANAQQAYCAGPAGIPYSENGVGVTRLFYITTPRCRVTRDAPADKKIHHE